MTSSFLRSIAIVAIGGTLTSPSLAFAALTLDPSLDGDGFALVNFSSNLDSTRDLAVDSDGSMVLVGMSRQGNFDYLAVSRLDQDGALVEGFGTDGKLTLLPGGTPQQFGGADGRAVAIQPADHKIVIAGTWNENTGSGPSVMVVRLLSNGTPDPDFGNAGVVLLDFPGLFGPVTEEIELQDDGAILLGGGSNNPSSVKGFLTRLTSTGQVDTDFATNGLFLMDNVVASTPIAFVAIHQVTSGKIVAAGGSEDLSVIRLTGDGALDDTFSGDGVASVNVGFYSLSGFAIPTYEDTIAAVVLGDGRILIGGRTMGETLSTPILARFTSAGALDESFGTNGLLVPAGAPNGSAVFGIAPRASGDFVVTGLGMVSTQISQNGSLSSKLNTGFPPQAINALLTLDDGRVVGAGEQNISGADYASVAMRLDATDLSEAACTACGELNGDCRITTTDALSALRMAVGQTLPNLRADMDGNGSVTASDALAILRLAVGTGAPSVKCQPG